MRCIASSPTSDEAPATSAQAGRCPAARRARLVCLSLLSVGWLASSDASATTTLQLSLDPAQSSISNGSTTEPLAGLLGLQLGALPVTSTTALDVVALSLTAPSLSIVLRDDVANPGLGIVEPDGTFLIPLLFVSVSDGSASANVTLIDVTGNLLFDPGSGHPVELDAEIGFEGPTSPITASILAVPEPRVAWLAAAILGFGGCLAVGSPIRASREGRAL